jgi:hypothetical protein
MASKSKRKIGKIGLSEAVKRMNRSLKRDASEALRRQGRAEKSPINLCRGDPKKPPDRAAQGKE